MSNITLPLVIPQLTQDEQTALITSLAKQRLRRFRAATDGDKDAVALYLVDAELAAHLHAAVRFAEIALRESIHRALTATYGERWFQDRRGFLDETADAAFEEAERVVGVNAPTGKIVAQVMLGTWVNLLSSGNMKADKTRAYYVRDLWEPALKTAFSIPRRDIARLAQRVNWARNRISHCEPVVFGLPMPGLGGDGVQVRRSPERIFADVQALLSASTPPSHLADWLNRWAETHALFSHELASKALDHIAGNPTIELER